MTPDDEAELVRRMLTMHGTLRDLRAAVEFAAEAAKAADETALAFSAFHLSDSIGVYARQLGRFLRKEIESGKA